MSAHDDLLAGERYCSCPVNDIFEKQQHRQTDSQSYSARYSARRPRLELQQCFDGDRVKTKPEETLINNKQNCRDIYIFFIF